MDIPTLYISRANIISSDDTIRERAKEKEIFEVYLAINRIKKLQCNGGVIKEICNIIVKYSDMNQSHKVI